ncbi:N-6 DNA methylase [Vibrio nigripulchritudo]|uniref:N-6 DNA methylase n=1 Tax=Vibrio nigripulchritudo TaxID=28173 RepID=UPI0019099EFA|nr:N-6 DNA methylase [Vibrio nigripulchritudo]
MFSINSDSNSQFSPVLADALKSHPSLKDKRIYEVVEDLKMALASPTECEAPVLSVIKHLMTDKTISVDYFSALNQMQSRQCRSHGSEFFTPTALAEFTVLSVIHQFIDIADRNPDEPLLVVEPSVGTGMMAMTFIRVLALHRPDLLQRVQLVVCDINYNSLECFRLNYEIAQKKGLPLRDVIICHGSALEVLEPYVMQADLVIGNPPFHDVQLLDDTSIDLLSFYTNPCIEAVERGELCQTKFSGKNKSKRRKSVNLAESITELSFRLLKPSGLGALILPDGMLSNSKQQQIRQLFLEGSFDGISHNITSVVSFPSESFKHSGTSVKTSCFIFGRGESTDHVHFAQIDKVGWDTRLRDTESELNIEEIAGFRQNLLSDYRLRSRKIEYKKAG